MSVNTERSGTDYCWLYCGLYLHNILSIHFRLTDDQGSADVKYANPNLPFSTDNIDKLASNSIRFCVLIFDNENVVAKSQNVFSILSHLYQNGQNYCSKTFIIKVDGRQFS